LSSMRYFIAVSFRFNLGFHVKKMKRKKYVLKMFTVGTTMSNLDGARIIL